MTKKATKIETRPEKLFGMIGEHVALFTNEGSRIRGKLTRVETKRLSIGSTVKGDNEEKDFFEVPISFSLDGDDRNVVSMSNLARIELSPKG